MSTPPSVIAAQIARDLAGHDDTTVRRLARAGDSHAVAEALRRWEKDAKQRDRLLAIEVGAATCCARNAGLLREAADMLARIAGDGPVDNLCRRIALALEDVPG